MTETFKGYYLPPSLEHLERKLELEERPLADATILVPRTSPEEMSAVARTLRENRSRVATKPTAEIAEAFEQVSRAWRDNDRPEKKAALKYLPALTNLSPELIEYFQFRTLYNINRHAVEILSQVQIDESAFKGFVRVPGADTYLRGYAGFLGKLRLKLGTAAPFGITLVTYITPSNVPGLIECLGILLASAVRASVLVKTPSSQPLFAPMFARSVAAASPDIGETIAVMPWHGGDARVEDVIFAKSDAVSVVSSSETAAAVEKKINGMNQRGSNIKGCYHGGKFGLDLIAREHATRAVAGLAAIDGIGYEGYMCASPAFGFFVERGGPTSPEQFAELLAQEAEGISKAIPQTRYFRQLREKKLTELLAAPADGRKVYTSPEHDFAVVYEPRPSLKPVGQDRLFRVMPVDRIEDVIPLLKPWTKYLQTAGIAVPDARLMDLADKLGRAGLSNMRVVGTVPLPRLGESWDGNLPAYEFFIADTIHWVTINVYSVDREIASLAKSKEKLVKNGVFGLD